MRRRPGPGRGRRTAEQTRDLLLRAAVDLLRDRAGRAGDDVMSASLAHVRFTQVAERATQLVRAETGDPQAPQITTGAIYQLWPTQPDFQADLLLHVADLQAVLVPGLAVSVAWFREAAAQGIPLEVVLARLSEEVHRHYREDPLFRVELGFLLGAVDPRVRQALARRQEAFLADADRAWSALLDSYRLRLRPPHRIRDLTIAVASCIIGAVVFWFADPRGLADPAGGDPGGLGLVSRSVLHLVQGFTEPE